MAKKIEVQITGNSSSFEKALSRSGSSASSWGSKVGKGLAVAATAAGAALIGLGGFAVKAAVDFESSFAGVRKTVNATEGEFKQMERGLLDMSRRIPVNVNELNKIAEAAGQLGVKKKNILEFTEVVAKLGVSSNLAGEEGAAMLARFANVTGIPQDEFDNLGASIVALGNAGASTEAEIAAMALRIGAAGTQVGLTAPQILGLSNALSSVGIEAEAGGTAMSTALVKINNAVDEGGGKLAKFAAVSGMSAEQFAAQWKANPSQALLAFFDGLNKVQEGGGNVNKTLTGLGLTGMRLMDTLGRAANANDLFRKSLKLGEESWKANVALNKEAAERFKTTASQVQLLKNNLTAAAIVAGSELLPHLNRGLLALTDFASKFFQAKGFKAKLNVVWEGVQEAGQALTSKVGDAVAAIDWSAVWSKAQGIGEGLAAKLEQTDWGAAGAAIGAGLLAGVEITGEVGKKLADALTAGVRAVNWEQLGVAMGPGLAAAIVSAFATLLDPGFWARNWELALAVAATAFGGPLGKLGSKLVAPLGKLGGDIVLGIVGGIEKLSPRLGTAVLTAITKLPGIAAAALRPLTALVEKVFGKLGSLATFTIKVLGIAGALNALGHLVSQGAGKLASFVGSIQEKGRQWAAAAGKAAQALVERVVEWIGKLPSRALAKMGEVVAAIMSIGPAMLAAGASIAAQLVTGILGGLGGLAASVGSKVLGGLKGAASWAGNALHGSGPYQWTNKAVGEPMAQGVLDGWMVGIVKLGPAMTRTLGGATSTAAANIDQITARLTRQANQWTAFGAALTPVEAQLQRMAEAEEQRSLRSAVAAAREQLAKAQVIKNAQERNKAIGEANEALRVAELAQQRARLEGVAAQERAGRDKQVEAALAAIERMRTQIANRTEAMNTSFNKLGEGIQRAFGAKTQQLLTELGAKFDEQIAKVRAWQAELTGAEQALQGMTASEAELAALDKGEAERGRTSALAAAEEAVAKAQAMAVTDAETAQARNEAILAAEEQLRQAQLAITRARLSERAAIERAALTQQAADERAERDKQAAERIADLEKQKAVELQNLEEQRAQQAEALAKQLTQLQVWLAKHPGEWKKLGTKVQALLKAQGIDYEASGKLLGVAFADGLRKAENAVAAAAKFLAGVPVPYLKLHSPAERGPLSDLDTWWAKFGRTLVSGVDEGALRRTATRVASAMVPGMGGATYAGGTTSAAAYASNTRGGAGSVTVQVLGPVYTDDRGLEELTNKVAAVVQRRLNRNT